MDCCFESRGRRCLTVVKGRETSDIGPHFAETLCWHTHPEGLNDVITEWLKLALEGEEYISDFRYRREQRSRYTWARDLYAGIIYAHSTWSREGTIDSATRKFRDDLAPEKLLTVLQLSESQALK